MASYIHLTGDDKPTPSYPLIYKKSTNNFGGWSYAARPEAEDSKFYALEGEWFYVVKDRSELLSLGDQGTWMTSTNPNQLVSITDKDSITKSIPMNNLVTTRVNDMNFMFYGRDTNRSAFNQYIGKWDVSNVTNMSVMFAASSFNQPIGNWDVQNVRNMARMFHQYDGSNLNTFNQPIGNWDTGNVTDMGGMFHYNVVFNQPIGNWDVQNVTDMADMFGKSYSFNQDLSSWCVSSVYWRASFDEGTTAWTLPKPNFNNPPC